jgi:choline-sulfatase
MNKKPDIIWIYCDELRTDALNCYGNSRMKLHTPNIDRIADSGVRFNNHFCNSPVCVSSRCCTLMALPPEKTGVYNNEAAWRNFRLKSTFQTFPQEFAKNGYATANFGKIHVCRERHPGNNPDNEIFQYHDGTGGEMSIWEQLGEDAVQMIRTPHGGMNGGVFPDNEPYPPDAVTENALNWIKSTSSPYFARISILQPHTPVLPPARYVKMLEDQDPGLPENALDGLSAFEKRVAEIHGLAKMPAEKLRTARLHYYAQVAWVDDQVGLILDFLEKNNRLEQTIIIFGADHGNPIGDTGAFGKHTFTPTVHRVPLLISWPGTITSGQVREDICESLDIAKTLSAMAEIAPHPQFKGRDLFSDPAPEAIFSTIGFGQNDSKMAPNGGRGEWFDGQGWPRRSCIRTKQYRLDKNMMINFKKPNHEDEDVFLADVVNDKAEVKNLANNPQYSEIVKDLCKRLDQQAIDSVEIDPEFLVRW